MSLAIFDLDNTLLSGDSDHAWGEFLVAKGIVDKTLYQQANDHFYQQYQKGILDIHDYLAFALKPLSEHSKAQLDRWHERFMQEVIEPWRLPKGEAMLNWHKARGDCVLMATSTNRFIAEPIAKRLGVEHLIATELAFENGRYTGDIVGVPCYQQGKVTHLQAWLSAHQQNLDGSYGYSDSHNDIPLLEQVAYPYAVDADPELTSVAKQRGWSLISFRDHSSTKQALT